MSAVVCPLCGRGFVRNAEASRCHGGCPMGDKCNLVKCPGCGYEWPGDSRLVTWLKRVFGVDTKPGDHGPPGPAADAQRDLVQMKVRRP